MIKENKNLFFSLVLLIFKRNYITQKFQFLGACEVKYIDVNDPRFTIERSVGDLVAAHDFCIPEPLWKITILLSFNCYGEEATGI